MKIPKCLKSVKGTITKLSLIICLGFCLSFHIYSNPIILPPNILEVYLSSDDFYIEMLFDFDYNLDNFRLTGLYDTAEFNTGIEFIEGEVFYVTGNDFETPFYIDPEGDYINLEIYNTSSGNWYIYDSYGFPFGNIPQNLWFWHIVSAPVGEESMAFQEFIFPDNSADYWIVKELPNSIGSNPFQVSKKTTFSGYVIDRNDTPLPGVKIDYCDDAFYHYTIPTVPEIFTDDNGYFYTDNMFCTKYWFVFKIDRGIIGDSIVYLEPDSANYFEFKLDTLLTGIADFTPANTSYSISNIPNPFSGNTTFVIEATGQFQHQKGIIKIYSSEGYIIRILPIEISGEKQELNFNPVDKSLAAGVYFYSLEIGREKKASGKMVISR
jgi:hypothetical protein